MRRLLPASVLLGGIILFGSLAAFGQDARVAQCPVGGSDAKVLTTLELTRARDFWTRFPNAGTAPELESDTAAFVIVFDGPITLPGLGYPLPGESGVTVRNAVYKDVICVVTNGHGTIYVNVDMRGFVP